MSYECTCPKGHRLQVADAHVGERVSCPTCGESFVVPSASGKGQGSGGVPSPAKNGSEGRGWKPAIENGARWSFASLVAGRPMVAIGLMLVLFARGCDAVGRRGVERAEMKARAARDLFDEEWQGRRISLEDDIATLEEKKDPKADQKRVAELKTQLGEMPGRQAKERRSLESKEWRALDISARQAKVSHQINGYWREMFFVFATIVLATGLLVVSWSAEGAERWITLIMLAIVTVSVYIGGVAWIPLKP